MKRSLFGGPEIDEEGSEFGFTGKDIWLKDG